MTSPSSPEPVGPALQSFARSLRAAQPQARPAFMEQLDRWMEEALGRSAPATAVPPGPDPATRTIRVCVVEPHPLVREGVVQSLDRDPSIEVVGQADDGLAAMELAHAVEPDVMVLDLHLPGVGGSALIERLRVELPEVRALVVMADESAEGLLDAVEAGAMGYLSKATPGHELCQAVITVHEGGSVVPPELAAPLLREFSRGAPAEGPSVRPLLAARELEILRLVADGLTDNEIGHELSISPRTVQNHLTRIREKTGARWWERSCAWLERRRAR